MIDQGYNRFSFFGQPASALPGSMEKMATTHFAQCASKKEDSCTFFDMLSMRWWTTHRKRLTGVASKPLYGAVIKSYGAER